MIGVSATRSKWKATAVACALLATANALAADFQKGDTVTLTRDEPLYFKDSVHRQGTKGETFTVHSQNAESHKVFVVVKDEKGQPIGLSINEDALTVAARAPKPKATPLPDVSGPGKLGGFLGMVWGTSPATAKEVMEGREGVSFNPKESNNTVLIFTGGSFSEQEVNYTALTFLGSKLIKAEVALEFTGYEEGLFSLLRDALKKKYGQGNGGVGLMIWRFPNAETPREELSIYNVNSNVLVNYSLLLSPQQEQRLNEQEKENISTKDL